MLFSLTNPEIAILMMGIFLFAVLLGFPIAFTLMAMGVGFGYYAYFDPTRMEQSVFHNPSSFLFQKPRSQCLGTRSVVVRSFHNLQQQQQ